MTYSGIPLKLSIIVDVYNEGAFRSSLGLASLIFVYDTTMLLNTALPFIDVDQHDHFMFKLYLL